MKSKITKKLNKHLWTVVIIYTVFGLSWIFFSDTLAHNIFTNAQLLKVQLYKGTFFVIITACLLSVIIKRKNQSIKELFLNVRQRAKNFRDTFEQTAVGIAHISVDGKWIRVNKKLCEILGYERPILMKIPVDKVTHPADIQEGHKKDRKIMDGQLNSYVMKKRYLTKAGEPIFARLTKTVIKDKKNNIKYLSSIIEDITEQKKAENRLEKSLHEKEKLLAEIHHRVKNNLAVISGLLELQAFNATNKVVKKILKESLMRIKSMAMIHEEYYKSGSLTKVPLDKYLEEFVEYVRRSFSGNQTQITLDYSTEPVLLNINQAIPCGLVMNELLVNAHLHAFKKKGKGHISIALKKQNQKITLQVKDDGTGLPDSINIDDPSSLGLIIIQTLVKQLNGSISVERQNGTAFIITFKQQDKKGSSSNLN